jgi:chorismate-pyruvate lyase
VAAPHDLIPELETLVGLFHPSLDAVGVFTEKPADELPPVAQKLLAHQHHMTVTLEQHHSTAVNVTAVQRREDATNYAREILLSRQTDGVVVQYGIMRVRLEFLSKPVRDKIIRANTPLGRILIEHNVHRRINLFSLWQVEPSPYLAKLMQLDPPCTVYGRTALIYCDHVPAVELLEIVTI